MLAQHDVVQYWVYFFLLVSVLSLFVTILFTRKVIGADQGTAARRAMAAAMKERATALMPLTRAWKSGSWVQMAPGRSHTP